MFKPAYILFQKVFVSSLTSLALPMPSSLSKPDYSEDNQARNSHCFLRNDNYIF